VLRQLLPWRAAAEHLRGRSVFVYHHLIGVHAPYRPSPEARAALSLQAAATIDPGSSDWYTADVSQQQVQELRASYEALAWDVDRRAAELLDGLKTGGAWNDALVIVTADHGEEFLEHGRTAHASQLYEESLRVPLLVKFPAGSAEARYHGRRVSERVRLLDLAPTVQHFVFGTEPDDCDGRSLLPLLRGSERLPSGRRVLAYLSAMRSVSGRSRLYDQHAVIEGRFKAISGWRADPSQDGLPRRFERGDPIVELYDLSADAAERQNLAKREFELWQTLVALSRDAAAARPTMEDGPARAARPDARERRETEERLRALGYLK
jgi:arylsulfatase A-like enzyme